MWHFHRLPALSNNIIVNWQEENIATFRYFRVKHFSFGIFLAWEGSRKRMSLGQLSRLVLPLGHSSSLGPDCSWEWKYLFSPRWTRYQREIVFLRHYRYCVCCFLLAQNTAAVPLQDNNSVVTLTSGLRRGNNGLKIFSKLIVSNLSESLSSDNIRLVSEYDNIRLS